MMNTYACISTLGENVSQFNTLHYSKCFPDIFTLLSHTPLLLIILNPDLFKQTLLTACLLTTIHPSCFNLWHPSTRKIWGELTICLPFAREQWAKLPTAVTTSCCHIFRDDSKRCLQYHASLLKQVFIPTFSFTFYNQLILSTPLLQNNPKNQTPISPHKKCPTKPKLD